MQSAAAAATASTASAAVTQADGITPVRVDHEQGAVGGDVGGLPSHRLAIRDGAIAASFEVFAP